MCWEGSTWLIYQSLSAAGNSFNIAFDLYVFLNCNISYISHDVLLQPSESRYEHVKISFIFLPYVTFN